ncbi:MAG: NH(3)-dependent NAD(+) synthetase [Firmicutes bacterium ADurb.Bin506]|jgi:NAD+ synthase|nr:MAG: NH(3)-dependent NAD(+) synthetase [Firmicutes bacterium ADurb.Bin506]
MDNATTVKSICDWMTSQVTAAGARGIVFGMSGGIDSAVVAGLATRCGFDVCLGVAMPCHSDPTDLEHASDCARAFGLPMIVCDLSHAYDAQLQMMESVMPDAYAHLLDPARAHLARANVKPRLRMTVLYYYANELNLLVVGTSNRSELTVGYFTKYGDGGVDITPIAGLVKSEVRELARYLGVPQAIIDKPPTAGLWAGQTDEGEMGMSYEQLDRYILTGEGEPRVVDRVEALARASAHKMSRPAAPVVSR